MRYFVVMISKDFLIVSIFTCQCMIILALNFNKADKTQENVLNISVISNVVEQYIKPYIQSLQLAPASLTIRTAKETPIEKAIREKIDQLKPYLQDDDNNKVTDADDNIIMGGNDETTILEFVPDENKKEKNIVRNRKEKQSVAFKTNIQKYKKLREKIKRSLDKETLSDKTKKMVIKTLDDLIAQLIGNQCTWKSVDHAERTFRMGKGGIKSILKANNMSMEEWQMFKLNYQKLTHDVRVKDSLSFLNELEGLFTRLIDEAQTRSKRYKLKCQLVEIKNPKNYTKNLKEGPNMFREFNDISVCANFKLCSDELKVFMLDFYNSLNDTVVSAFRNYAAMYVRDVATEGSYEKEAVVSVIKNISYIVENKVRKLFIKENAKIKLDVQKNKAANIKVLAKYINNTVEHIKNHIKKHLETYLKSLRARLIFNVKQDIDVNLGVDLGNLKRDFTSRICTVFVTCNGRYSNRRTENTFDRWGNEGLKTQDSNSAYIKVQLTLDDNFKDNLVKNKKLLLRNFQENGIEGNIFQDARRDVALERYMRYNVTRTTNFITNLTTKSNKVLK